MNSYNHYYRDHFKATFSEKDVRTDLKWFFSQWQYINSKSKIAKGEQILEIGSGLGGIYKFLLDKENYTGLELDKEAVNFTDSYFQTNSFLNCSFEDFKTKLTFNKIFAIEVLEHFENPLENIKKIHFMLKKSGQFIGTTPYPYRKNVLADQTHNFVLHPENWKRLFLKNGFNDVKLFPMSFIPYLWRINKAFNPVLPFYCPFTKTISTVLIVATKTS